MFSGLYGDLPKAKDEVEEGNGPDATGQDGPAPEEPAKTEGEKGWMMKNTRVMMAPSVLKKKVRHGPGEGAKVTKKTGVVSGGKKVPQPAPRRDEQKQEEIYGGRYDSVEDEYDPAVPNEYEKIKEKKERERIKVDEEARRLQRERDEAPTIAPRADVQPAEEPKTEKGMTLAQKMMEKMGWKSGEGLGKNKQGLAAPLTVQKTNAAHGRVGTWRYGKILL